MLNIFPNELKNTLNGKELCDNGIYEWYKLPKNKIIEYVSNRNIIINEHYIYNSFIPEIFNFMIIIRNPIDRFLSHCNMIYYNDQEYDKLSFDDYVLDKINKNNFHLAYNLINLITMNSDYENKDNLKLFFERLELCKIFYLEDKNFNEKITIYIKNYCNKDFTMCYINKAKVNFNIGEETLKFIEKIFEKDVYYYNLIIEKYCN